MRHTKDTVKLGRTGSHLRCMFANMLKELIDKGSITTTVAKAKELRRHADNMITLAKENDLAARRKAIGEMMIQYNTLTPKEQRAARAGDTSAYNTDRRVLDKLFSELGPRFARRNGGYTRIIKSKQRVGDGAQTCVIQYLEA